MSLRSFTGGIKVPGRKSLSANRNIEDAGIPDELVLFLSQHTGAPSVPVVKPGDHVKRGQKIAEPAGAVSAALHAPVSGRVKSIEPRYQPVQARLGDAIILEPDGKGLSVDMAGTDVDRLSKQDILALVRDMGLVGLGGGAFPTSVKLSPPPSKRIDTYLLNGIECEPYLTADQRLMEEEPGTIVTGLRAFMKCLDVKTGIVCIEDNKPEAVKAMEKAVKPFQGLRVEVLPTKYPQGGEKQLIQAVLGREVPPPPGLPLDVGVVISNVGTAHAMGIALLTGLPLVERIVTVTGEGIANPTNFRALLGTPVPYLLDKAGGYRGTPGKVIMGGPMMGTSLKSTDVPVLKGTSGILVLPSAQVPEEKILPCIRCGRCVEACPMGLLPVWIAAYADKGYLTDAEKYRALDCIECGACSYKCPSKRPLVQSIRLAKARIQQKRRAASGK